MSQDIVALTNDLYKFMLAAERLLPKRAARDADAQSLLDKAHELAGRLQVARARAAERAAVRLDEAQTHLKAFTAALRAHRSNPDKLQTAWKALGRSYEGLVLYVREARLKVPAGIRLGHLKPKNYARNLFHVSMAMTGILLYELVLDRSGMILLGSCIFGFFVFLDIGRRVSDQFNEKLVQRIFGLISRPSEQHKTPAATWYMGALLIGVIIYPRYAVELGTLVLGVGDPIASLVGKRWGRHKLIGDKSVEGTAGFVLASLVAGVIFLMVVPSGITLASAIGIAAVVAVAGAVAELFTGQLDDNFTIPLVAGLVAMLLLG